MLILLEKIVGHSPLCPAADTKSLGAHEVEEAPVEQPPPPLGAVGGLEDGRDHRTVLVHPLEPGVERPLVVGPAHPPVVIDLQVRLEVEQQRMRGHSPAYIICILSNIALSSLGLCLPSGQIMYLAESRHNADVVKVKISFYLFSPQLFSFIFETENRNPMNI